jgi:hypothetical protein
MMADDLTSAEWADDGEGFLDDEAGRQAADRIRGQLELFPELFPPAGIPGDRANFAVMSTNLIDAARVTNLKAKDLVERPAMVTVDISGNRFRVTATRRSVTCRAVVPTEPNPAAGSDQSVTFGFPHRVLEALGSYKNPERLNWKVDLNKPIWSIRSGSMTLKGQPPLTMPDAVCGSWELKERRHVTEFNVRSLRRTLAYLGLVARKNPHKPEQGVANISNGQGRAGRFEAFAIVNAPGLDGVRLGVPAEDLSMVYSILYRMRLGATHLFETETHQIISDDVIDCCIAKPAFSFPNLDKVLDITPTDRFFVRTQDLIKEVYFLSPLICGPNRDVLVELNRGGELGTNLTLNVRHSGGSGRTVIETRPPDDAGEPAKQWRITIPLRSLMRLLPSASDDHWVEIALLDKRAVSLTCVASGHRNRGYIAARPDGVK